MTPTALLRRLLLALPTLLGVIVVVFVLLRIVPGDPVSMMIPGEATPAEIAHLRASYGLDKPIGEQFVIYLGGVLRGDFGTSISLKQDVLGLVMGRLPATLELALTAMVLAVSAGFALALVSVLQAGRWLELAIDAVTSTTLAIPEFLWALILILMLGVLWPVLPISGRSDPTQSMRFVTQFYLLESLARGNFDLAAELAKYLVLPALALSLPLMAVITRVLKASLQEAMVQDYILFARVNGFGRMRVLLGDALPNALIQTVTVTGVHFIFLVGSTVLVELIFSYPGIGNMLYEAAVNRDLPLIQGVTIVFAVLFILLNLVIDVAYLFINPRVRHL
jgi:ABC-type dipeptide/oligopeptide/nickel transport system permease component